MLPLPQTGYERFKLWIWNSMATWMLLAISPNPITITIVIIATCVSIYFIAQFTLEIIMTFEASIILYAAILLGITIPIDVLALLLITACFLIIFLIYHAFESLTGYDISERIIWGISLVLVAAIAVVFIAIGLIVGLVTSFALFFKAPHPQEYTLEDLYEATIQAIDYPQPSAVYTRPEIPDLEQNILENIPEIDLEFKFADFNPNIAIITDIQTGKKKPLTDQNQKVIKASNHNYYLQTEFDQAALSDVICGPIYLVPEYLKEKFVDGQNTCPITQEVILRENAVRAIPYGHYYDKSAIINALKRRLEDPISRQPLTAKYLSHIDGTPLSESDLFDDSPSLS